MINRLLIQTLESSQSGLQFLVFDSHSLLISIHSLRFIFTYTAFHLLLVHSSLLSGLIIVLMGLDNLILQILNLDLQITNLFALMVQFFLLTFHLLLAIFLSQFKHIHLSFHFLHYAYFSCFSLSFLFYFEGATSFFDSLDSFVNFLCLFDLLVFYFSLSYVG